MLYWVFKWVLVAPLGRLLFRPRIRAPSTSRQSGPAILASNHISAGDTFLLPALMKRRLTFPAKAELFDGRGPVGQAARPVPARRRPAADGPLRRPGQRHQHGRACSACCARASCSASTPRAPARPDGRLYKGKTGVARLVLRPGVPVIPIGMINTQFVRGPVASGSRDASPGIRIGEPLDFSAYAGAGNDRDVLRWVTDEIMNAVMELSGQTYVDAYGAIGQAGAAKGRAGTAAEVLEPSRAPGRTAPAGPTARRSQR